MIYVECDPDEVLVKKLGFTRKQIIHEGGKFELCKRMQQAKNSIGLIEYDQGKSNPLYLNEFTLVEAKHDVEIYFEKKSGNKLVVIHDNLEEWIIKNSEEAKINIAKFGLSNSPNQLHREINSKLDKFQQLLTALIEQKSPALLHLQVHLKKD